MDLTLWQLCVASLATWQAVEIYHHSYLFASIRARAELMEGKLGELLMCPFCLSVWVASAAVVGIVCNADTVPGWAWLPVAAFKVFGYGLAVSRAANLANDLTHTWCRTPRANVFDLPDERESKK